MGRGVDAFEWDDINIEHLANHGVTDVEVDQMLSNRNIVMPNRKYPDRKLLIGKTNAGRVLIVSIEPTRMEGTWRPITAREAEPEESKRLERA
ncbi:MAG: BrnT family toxin [Actinobacteria bacterium]|nr:BrnT family toxin [Actinomycetota bacterium]